MTQPDDPRFEDAQTMPVAGEPRRSENLPLPPGLEPLSQRYDILGEIGRGGMGVVYWAKDRETGDIVALKVLQENIAKDPELIERFKAELVLARKITHANVCRVHELLRFGDVAVIAMEYIEGESLRQLLRRVESLSLRFGLKVMQQVLAGVAQAHAQGVVHRDLKPENILLARDGPVKVMDFGIARSFEAEAAQTVGITGTPAYMSPEQAAGKAVDHRSDIYALGLILYEVFVGQPAFRADTPVALAMKHIHDRAPRPRDVEPYLPAFLERAIEKCLEKDPKKRFQSIAELEAALAEEKVPTAEPEAEPAPAPELSVWRRGDWILVAVSAASLIYVLIFSEVLFPYSKMKLEVDGISARRTAEELAKKVGRPFPDIWEARLLFRRDLHARTMEAMMKSYNRGITKPAYVPRWPAELLGWRIQFRSSTDHLLLSAGAVPERFAEVDSKGKVDRLTNGVLPELPANYQPLRVEERRVLARQAAETACGAIPARADLEETSGGGRGAWYTAAWRSKIVPGTPEVPVQMQVQMFAERVVNIRCTERTDFPDTVLSELSRFLDRFLWTIRGAFGVMLLVGFFIQRGYRLPGLWKRLPLAIALGLAATWIIPFSRPPGLGAEQESLPDAVLPVMGFAMIALIWFGLATVESYLRRRAPQTIATYLMVWRGAWRERAISLAVVRGALLGAVFLGVLTLMLHIWLGVAHSAEAQGLSPSRVRLVIATFQDPSPVGLALETFSPALYAAAVAFFEGALIALLLLGIAWAEANTHFFRRKKQSPREVLVGFYLTGWFMLAFMPLHLFRIVGAFPPAWVAGLLPLALLVPWLWRRYDALTVWVAVSTGVLWLLNYPMLVILSDVGNAAHWGLFFVWGALVLTATALAFRGELRRAFQNVTAPE